MNVQLVIGRGSLIYPTAPIQTNKEGKMKSSKGGKGTKKGGNGGKGGKGC